MNLVPMTSKLAEVTAPNTQDLEEHAILLESLIKAFPAKAPPESLLSEGLCAIDNYYRNRLSKTSAKRLQKLWSAKDVCIKASNRMQCMAAALHVPGRPKPKWFGDSLTDEELQTCAAFERARCKQRMPLRSDSCCNMFTRTSEFTRGERHQGTQLLRSSNPSL